MKPIVDFILIILHVIYENKLFFVNHAHLKKKVI